MHFDEIRLASTWAEVTPVAPPGGSTLVWDFEDGSLQGWTQVMTNSDYSPQYFEVGAGGDAQAGVRSMKQHLADTWPGFADLAHKTLWVRSPEFKLNGSGDLTFWIFGGGTNAFGTPPINEAGVPAQSVDTSVPPYGWHGIVLRKVATGDFVLVGNKTVNGTVWEQVSFTATQLAALDQSAVYTLDAIDARNNSWGWFNFDSVRVPGVLVAGLAPSLTVSSAVGNQIRIAWPVTALSYTLQSSTSVTGGFTAAGLPIAIEGNENVAYDTIGSGARFYRLIKSN
jgi:hypothetical protein